MFVILVIVLAISSFYLVSAGSLTSFVRQSSLLLSKSESHSNKQNNNFLSIRGGSAHVKYIQDKSVLDQLIADPKNKGKLIVIDFTAVWCGPCKMIAPLFDEMSEEFSDSCIFIKVDVDQGPAIAQAYQVMSMPTFLFIKNGKIVDRFSGASVEKLRQVIFSKIED